MPSSKKSMRLILNALDFHLSLPPAALSFPMKRHEKLEFSDLFIYLLVLI